MHSSDEEICNPRLTFLMIIKQIPAAMECSNRSHSTFQVFFLYCKWRQHKEKKPRPWMTTCCNKNTQKHSDKAAYCVQKHNWLQSGRNKNELIQIVWFRLKGFSLCGCFYAALAHLHSYPLDVKVEYLKPNSKRWCGRKKNEEAGNETGSQRGQRDSAEKCSDLYIISAAASQ